jgi:hypothetical protein
MSQFQLRHLSARLAAEKGREEYDAFFKNCNQTRELSLKRE